jgi:putative peptidoglycan lipid II flippase
MTGQSQTLKQVTVGIALLVLLSKGVGFFREVIIAYRFGTGIEYDTYLIAVSVPIALFSLFGYAFSNLFIPGYSYAVSADDKKTGLSALWSDFNLSLLAAMAAMLVIIALAPNLIRYIAPGLKNRYLPEAVLIVRVSSCIVVLAVLEAFFRSVLNAEKRFFIPAAGPILANIILIISIISFAGTISTRAILYGLVLGYLAQVVLVFFPFRRSKILDYFHFGFIQKHTGKFVTIAIIILIIEGASQVYAIVDRYFASSMDPGIVSALGYAYLLIMLPVAIFAYALSTALFPYMTDAFADADKRQAASLISRGIKISLLLALPATMIFWVFSEKIVLLLFRRGAFDMQSVEYTAGLMKYLALSLTGQFILWVMSRAYYAARRYGILFVHVIVLAAKIIFTIICVNAYGYIGLAVSSSISYSIGAALLMAFTGRALARIDVKAILVYVVRVMTATAAGFLAAYLVCRPIIADWVGFGQLLMGLPLAVALSLLATGVVGYGLNISDIRNLPEVLWRRKKPIDDTN